MSIQLTRILVIVGLLIGTSAFAQDEPGPCDPPTDKKILKLLADAEKAKDAESRHHKLKEALENDAECATCLYELGMSAYRIGKESGKGYDAAIRYFDQLETKCPQFHSNVPYHMGIMHYAQDEFAEAAKAFEAFREFPTDDPTKLTKDYDKKYADVEAVMPELQFYVDFYKNTAPLDPRIVRGVSTPAEEYLPMLSPDNELMFITRKSKVKAKGDIVSRDVEELIEARRTDSKSDFNAGEALPEPFNLGDGYGGVTINVNNKEMFVTVCSPADARGYVNCDIYRTHYDSKFDMDKGGQTYIWTGLDNLGPNINTPDGWESQPTLSADGRTLYFAVNRQNTDATDIFQSTRDEKGEWAPARPVPGINTMGDEKAPFMHSDSRTMYFAAKPPQDDPDKGHKSIGGYDIFFSKLGDDGTWGKPKNIGNPLNTEQDEHGLIVSADGRTAYFASGRFQGVGGLDIYGFDLPVDVRPEEILIVKGTVRDEAGRVVKDATVEIKYMDTRKTEIIHVDSTDGRYATIVNLKENSDVVVTVKKKDHVFDTHSFSLEDTVRAGVAKVDMTVQKIAVGKSYRVNDIKYTTNSAEISKTSEFILDELIEFMTENPKVKIRIEGHTDNVGNTQENMVLSNDRAFTVMGYLQDKGIAGSRLAFKGLGPTVPLKSNDTEAGRAENRRTEFVIIGL
ncbi:MAG: OmpA family protein [Flavobacteriales bacterium]|nr:OmpA family protein [Flavobacteriales bacterium]MBK6945898.1 OmpA family protein [Flavobacteriales bacterium]MBK9536729.1 OmpA family protein [Flavobacteriales bacterium]MBP9138208.1 OmpA family protein [Flavobacteriales bacterium]HQV53049.1 OmpA family protein [Flavobacteriales bacterium]